LADTLQSATQPTTKPTQSAPPTPKVSATVSAVTVTRSRKSLRERRKWLSLKGLGLLRSVLVIGVLLGLWETAPRLGWVEPSLIPPLSKVAQAWWALLENGQLWDNTSASLMRAGTGFAIAVLVGIPLGILLAWYGWLHQLVDPLLELFRNTAPLALLPVFTLLLGIGETSKIAIILYACLFPVLLNTVSGVRSVDPLLVKSARSMNLSSLRLFQKVILPSALPTIFTGIRMAGASSILVLIAAEMVGAKAGLGYLINYTQFNFMIPQMYAGILTIAAIGLIINATLVRLERRFSRWRVDVRG
jgi:NitT/TauT family transport system permease protein